MCPMHGSLLTTEVRPPPLAELSPSGLAGCHIGGHGRAEASWMALSLAGVQQAGLEVLLGRNEAVAGSRQGGADPRTSCPRDTGMRCSRLRGQPNNSAPFSLRGGVSNLQGVFQGFCLLPAALGRHSGLSLALTIKVQSSFCQKRITASF